MKLSFFDWIREGVKQSVLLGISDAAEHLANPEEVESLNQEIAAAIQHARLPADPAATKRPRSGRKALGRSLSRIIEEEKAA